MDLILTVFICFLTYKIVKIIAANNENEISEELWAKYLKSSLRQKEKKLKENLKMKFYCWRDNKYYYISEKSPVNKIAGILYLTYNEVLEFQENFPNPIQGFGEDELNTLYKR